MAVRRPLVVINGEIKELPVGDSLNDSENKLLFPVPVVGKATHTVFKDEELPELVFSSDGDIVFALVSSEDL
jgi:hypothetical protein